METDKKKYFMQFKVKMLKKDETVYCLDKHDIKRVFKPPS